MAKKIMQVRFYGDGNASNYPAKLTSSKLKNGSVFEDYLPMCYLKITGPTGLKFFLNNGIHNVAIGESKEFELDLDGVAEITNLIFDKTTISLITAENPLVVDIISNY